MELKDFNGKLNDHKKFQEVIKILENRCKHIELVLIDEKDNNELVKIFEKDILSKKVVSKWWGTTSVAKNKLYTIKASKKLFSKLMTYESFCKYYESENGDHAEITDFGYDDIAFFDNNEEPLLFTTTHEGYITVREDLIV